MRAGDVLKVQVENISPATTESELRQGFSQYGTVQAVSLHRGFAEVTYTSNGIRFIDSTGIGELRLQSGNLRVVRT
jgi:RNA recognition motif-containing protein